MSELLLELFSEEIPARMQVKAASQMLEIICKEIKELGADYQRAEYLVTPRRITLHISGLPKTIAGKEIEKKGPKIDARAEAIEGFLRSTGLNIEQLSVIDGFYCAKIHQAEKDIAASLQSIIEQMLISFVWPKSMRIDSSRARWVRPLRNILCLFEAQVLPVKFAGLVANNHSFGHRFMAPQKLVITDFADYKQQMKQAFVILSEQERREIIIKQIKSVSNNLNPVIDEELLAEVVGLVEYPNTLLGKIDERFLKLPKEVLVSAMKNHQRYFSLEDAKGDIAPYFLVVANVKHDDDNLIIAGNEKVLQARFADAEFFFKNDLKQPTSERLAKLAKLTFHHRLGTMFDKTNRIITIAEFIAAKLGGFELEAVKKAALLCRTDLVSEMVGEFPELQGIMGQYYALHLGEENQVALAIAESYRPTSADDIGDVSKLGAIIAIADKIDSIVGLWLAGEKPTSSKDPFALRRAALGIIKLIRYHCFDLSLTELLQLAEQNYQLGKISDEIIEFLNDRLRFYLKDYRHDLIAASNDKDNIYQAIRKLEELQQFVDSNKDAKELLFALKRICNILEQTNLKPDLKLDEALFQPIEQQLYNQLKLKKPCFEDLLSLVEPINQFFDQLLVNDQDPKLKQNRLNLLYNVINLSNKVADFSVIENIYE